MLPFTGLTAACGKELVRKPAPSLLVRPRSPFTPVVTKFATVVAEANDLPWLVDFRSWIDAEVPEPPLSQNTYTAWSVPTTTLVPCTMPVARLVVPVKLTPWLVDFVNTILVWKLKEVNVT